MTAEQPNEASPFLRLHQNCKMKSILGSLLLVLVLASALPSLRGNTITFDKGSGAILEGTESRDGEFALVLGEQDANLVVNLPAKREVLRLGTNENFSELYFPGMNHRSLDVLWGPDQEGSRFGIVFYGGKWESMFVYLVEVDPEFGSQTDISDVLNAGASAAEAARGTKHADYYVFTFSPGGVVDPNGELVITDPLDVKINYLGQVPVRGGPDMEWTENAPTVEGTLTVRLSRTADGPRAEVLGVSGVTPSKALAGSPAHDAAAFKALRSRIDDETEGSEVRKVKVHLKGDAGRKLSYMGYVEANVLKQLVYVDSQDDDNETFVIYYWNDGLLVSAFEVREGSDTQMSEVAKTIEIYNFENENLVGWIRDGVEADPNEDGFASIGEQVWTDATERAQVIYDEIGAD